MKTFIQGFLVAVAVTSAVNITFAQSHVPEKDNQSWNDFQLTVPMTKQVDFQTQITLRLGDNATQTADQRFGFGFVLKPHKYLSFNPFYFHREARPPHGRHEREDRVTLGATFTYPIRKFTLSDRNWFEKRWREPQVDSWRYRNRLQVEHPFTIEKKKFTWFVSAEVFYDWSLHVWPRDRLSGGVSHIVNKHLTVQLYYTRQNDGHTRPGDLNIIWSAWRFKL